MHSLSSQTSTWASSLKHDVRAGLSELTPKEVTYFPAIVPFALVPLSPIAVRFQKGAHVSRFSLLVSLLLSLSLCVSVSLPLSLSLLSSSPRQLVSSSSRVLVRNEECYAAVGVQVRCVFFFFVLTETPPIIFDS